MAAVRPVTTCVPACACRGAHLGSGERGRAWVSVGGWVCVVRPESLPWGEGRGRLRGAKAGAVGAAAALWFVVVEWGVLELVWGLWGVGTAYGASPARRAERRAGRRDGVCELVCSWPPVSHKGSPSAVARATMVY